jgi:DNA relaxase NicK
LYGSIEEENVTQWAAAVDWVTCTWRDDKEEGAFKAVTSLARDAAHETSDGSLTPSYGVIQGYKGSRCGKVFVGRLTGQGTLLTASGAAAHWLVSKSGMEPDNVSRLDVQTTFWQEKENVQLVKQVAEKSAAARVGAKGRPWRVQLRGGFGEGDTAYLGARTSDSFLRCYDKGRESGEAFYNKAIRYEAEYKRDTALRAYHHLMVRGASGFDCFNICALSFRARGVELPNLRPLSAPIAPRRDDVEDDIERRLDWLRIQVGPTVERLLTEGVSRAKIEGCLRMCAETRET